MLGKPDEIRGKGGGGGVVEPVMNWQLVQEGVTILLVTSYIRDKLRAICLLVPRLTKLFFFKSA